MQRFTIVLAANDPGVAVPLTTALDPHFRIASTVTSFNDLKTAIARLRADAAIIDLETISLDDVAKLRREFPVPLVCTHRIPDEELWTAALDAGANDVCDRFDFPAINRAITQAQAVVRSTAA